MAKPGHERSVGIVGGGLAGLAAAAMLTEHGYRVDLFEARGRLGGRATAFRDPASQQWIDNCQHVSLGCCTEFLDFCRRTNADRSLETFDTLHFIGPDGRRCDLRASVWLPVPLHLAPALWGLRYLTIRDRMAVAHGLIRMALMPREPNADLPCSPEEPTAGEWLRKHGQSELALRRFWSVVIVSALAESIDRVALSAARQVFVEGFMTTRRGYEMSLPRGTLEEFYGQVSDWLEANSVTVSLGTSIDEVTAEGSQRIRGLRFKDGTSRDFDYVVLAVPWRRVEELVPHEIAPQMEWLGGLHRLGSSPITSVHLWFDKPLTDLRHAVLVDRLSQWVFRRPTSPDDAGNGFYYQVVISASRDLAGRNRDEVIKEVTSELEQVWPSARGARLLRSRMITEQHAVFSPIPGVDHSRPRQTTAIPNLMLAGDWTRTGWPATMEGAVRSGHAAARAIIVAGG